MTRLAAFVALVSLAAALSADAADTWRWLGKTNVKDDGSIVKYGLTWNSTNNWVSVASGLAGIPRAGDAVVSDGCGSFGQDFGTSLAFAGVTVTANVASEFVSQGTLALQTGGAGLVVSNAVSSIGTVNGSLAFTGSGEAIVDIGRAGTRLKVQKSCYGNADVTLVKRGEGILQANDGYAPDSADTLAYTQSRATTGGYYPNRRFVFGGVKIQGGTLDMRQYYWVRDCDIRFDGDGVTLALMKFPDGDKSKVDLGVHSLALSNCRIRETANVTGTTHAIFGEDARCYLHMFGDRMEDSSFSGALTGGAGLVWAPGNGATFTFGKSVSPTTGILAVSNGTVRVTDGAGFSSLASLAVSGTNAVFAVDATAACDWSAVPFVLTDGGTLAFAAGARILAKSVTVGGVGLAAGYYESPTAPSRVTRARIGCDIRFTGGASLTCPKGTDLTFDGLVATTNTTSLSVTAPEGSTVTFNRLVMSRNGGTLSGAGRIVFNDSVHFRDRPAMSGTVTVELHRGGNRLNGNMGTFSGGTLKAMAPYVVTWSNTVRQAKSSAGQDADGGQNTMINAKGAFTFDLNGFDQSIDIIAMHADGTSEGGCVTSAKPATLHLVTGAAYWPRHNYSYGFSDFKTVSSENAYGYETADKGRWTGAVNLSYEAAAGKVRSMMRVSSSTGRVEVVSGKLVFVRRARTAGETFDLKGGSANPYPRLTDEDGAWPLASAVSVKGGTLKLEHSLAFGRDVDVSLSSGATLELDDGVVFCCRSLTVDGARRETGRFYDAATTPQIAGAGRLYVRGSAPSSTLHVK